MEIEYKNIGTDEVKEVLRKLSRKKISFIITTEDNTELAFEHSDKFNFREYYLYVQVAGRIFDFRVEYKKVRNMFDVDNAVNYKVVV